MTYITALNRTEDEHLAHVINEMRELGAPTIKVYYTGEEYIALEGSHRLAAAWELGLEPEFEEMEEDEEIDHDVETYGDLDSTCTVAELVNFITDQSVLFAGKSYDVDRFDPENR